MKFRKVYVEISNICNLKCSFCPGTIRPVKYMTKEEFTLVCQKIRPYTDFIYFHIMGEPLLHPYIEDFLEISNRLGFKVIITTNGTLIDKTKEILLSSSALHRINISLHSFESNIVESDFKSYLDKCFTFGKDVNGEKIVVYRLWNNGGEDKLNKDIISYMKTYFTEEWIMGNQATTIALKTFLEYGDKFDWPNLSVEENDSPIFCYGLRDQIGILCDGTIVPCCLDHNGDIPLGNIYKDNLEDVLSSEKAMSIKNGFMNKKAIDPLCKRCGFAKK